MIGKMLTIFILCIVVINASKQKLPKNKKETVITYYYPPTSVKQFSTVTSDGIWEYTKKVTTYSDSKHNNFLGYIYSTGSWDDDIFTCDASHSMPEGVIFYKAHFVNFPNQPAQHNGAGIMSPGHHKFSIFDGLGKYLGCGGYIEFFMNPKDSNRTVTAHIFHP